MAEYLEIVTLPNKLTYEEGEAIDITGLVVTSSTSGVIPHSELTYTQHAALRTGITATRSNAIVSRGNTLLSENDGSRSPVIKLNDGDAACIASYDGIQDIWDEDHWRYGGNWFGIVTISDNRYSAYTSAGTSGTSPYGLDFNNLTYYYQEQFSNSQWGMASEMTNPLGLPELYGYKFATVNEQPTKRRFLEALQIIGFQFIGGAVTLEHNGVIIQYGIDVIPFNERAYVGVNGSASRITKMYVGVNGTPRKVIKGYVGVNGTPRRFW